ncbi:MAG: DUF1501 domain-containing protein [Pirellulaceae bacterium]|jgi:hypothetical protein|nr:DUF1501 domain-containing protein [Pirellulaceae bacterium]MDP7015927.1 DUF1501 domain-containing protein [Pirellulaceae bacterium]
MDERIQSAIHNSSSSFSSGSGRVGRREVLRAGLTGFTGLALPGLYRLRAEAAAEREPQTAIILVWLRGGASHLETFDPKPEASSEFRGPYDAIDTNVPGMRIGELLPRLSKIADKYALLRSVAHDAGGHPAGSLRVLGGDLARADKPKPEFPDWMTVAHYVRRESGRALPNYVSINPVDRYDSFVIAGPGYLGPSYEPFKVTGDPSSPKFTVQNIGVKDPQQLKRIQDRVGLKEDFENLQRVVDATGLIDALDKYENQALSLLTSSKAGSAFDLTKEPDSVRDRYGRNQWGQQCLMARRLVEAGVEIIATEFDGPLCARPSNWDDHAVNNHVFQANKYRAPYFDQAVSALIEDVYQRNLDKRVMVIVTGEFGRTPRISYAASSGGGAASGSKGTKQPGRDHWPRANTMLFAGGGIQTGQVIGATDPRGEDPVSRRVTPHDFLATIYQHLGIDYRAYALEILNSRRIVLPKPGEPIPELRRVYS